MKPCRKCGAEDRYPSFDPNRKTGRCRPCYQEAARKLYAKDPEKKKQRNRKWRNENPEKSRKSVRRWREKNPEKVKELKRAFKKANPEKVRIEDTRRRARKAQAVPPDAKNCPRVAATYFVSNWLRQQGDDVHVDHIYPISRGGLHIYENLRIIDAKENLSKNARLPSQDEIRISKILKASSAFLA